MDKTSILNQLFEKDYAVKDVELIPDRLTIKVRNIGFEDQSILEETIKSLYDADYSQRQFLQFYALHQLSHTVVQWGTRKFDDAQDALNFLKTQSVAMIDKAVQEQQAFEKEVREAINLKDIKETFSPGVENTDDSEPSQKESTSVERGPSEKP